MDEDISFLVEVVETLCIMYYILEWKFFEKYFFNIHVEVIEMKNETTYEHFS